MNNKHYAHIRCDLTNEDGKIRIIPNENGKYWVATDADQEQLMALWERGQK